MGSKGFIALQIVAIAVFLIFGSGVFVYNRFYRSSSSEPVVSSSPSAALQPSKAVTPATAKQPTIKATTAPTAAPKSDKGAIELSFYGAEGTLSPTVRLFDENLRFVSQIDWFQDAVANSPISKISGGKKYVFKDLAPGNYIVGALNKGYYKPKNISVSAGQTVLVTMEENSASTTSVSALKGRTFVDSNGNNKYDGGELDVSGVVSMDLIFLTKDGEKRIDGFSGFPGGPYQMRRQEFLLGKYIFKSGVQPGYTPASYSFDIGLYNTSDNVDIPFTTQSTYSNPSTIKGRVFQDANGNHEYDSGETRPSDYFPSVSLNKPDGQFRYGMATVDSNGEYSFSNLSPGKYLLEIEVPGYNAFQSSITVDVGSSEEKVVNFSLTKK